MSLFRTPFEQSLDPNNRWVGMAALVPWDDMAKVFYAHMSMDQGRVCVDLRIVLGALLVKHIEGISDEDTIQYIQENLYAQYFVGLPSFQTTPVFSPSLFVEIRKRLGHSGVVELNDKLLLHARSLRVIKHRARPQRKKDAPSDEPPGDSSAQPEDEPSSQPPKQERPPNKGTLKVDATVAPQHIGYPLDTRLLHESRQISERLIDELYKQTGHWPRKPRTYRRTAQNKYIDFVKKRKPRKKAIRKAQAQQLRYLKRNIGHLHRMLDELEAQGIDIPWQYRHWKQFWIIQHLYEQQHVMWRDKRRRVDDRIVNVAQPYVRPIKRGKAGKDTEFGAKINVSETEGFLRMDQADFDNFHEGLGLQLQIEGYKALYGYYPELVLADRIYLTRANRKYLNDNHIRHVGPPL
ncbi:MAG: IS5 family transposase, partial [bacterium]|nr:IS5 family transposase [bacterium]